MGLALAALLGGRAAKPPGARATHRASADLAVTSLSCSLRRSMFMYRRRPHFVPAMWRSRAAIREARRAYQPGGTMPDSDALAVMVARQNQTARMG